MLYNTSRKSWYKPNKDVRTGETYTVSRVNTPIGIVCELYTTELYFLVVNGAVHTT